MSSALSVCSSARPSVTQGWLITFPFVAWNQGSINTKSNGALFRRNFLVCPKRGKWGIFRHKIKTFELFCKSVHSIFLKLYLMTGIKKWAKVTILDYYGKVLLCLKWEKWVIFEPKINTFWAFSKFLYWIFLKLYLMADIKKWIKVTDRYWKTFLLLKMA